MIYPQKLNIMLNIFSFLFKKNDDNEPKTSYNVDEIKYDSIRNVLGKVIDYKTKYVIKKSIIYKGCLPTNRYLHIVSEGNDKNIVEWKRKPYDAEIKDATFFETYEKAKETLDDILINPNKYILQ